MPPLPPTIGPNEAEVRIKTALNGESRMLIRGVDGEYFDWTLGNEERRKVVELLLLPDESLTKKRWWNRLNPFRNTRPLIIELDPS